MMKRRQRGGAARKALAMLLMILAAGVSARATRVMVVSDLHYMAESLYKDSPLFIRALKAGDGKVAQHGEALMDALQAQVLREAPDALVITGDLTFNGERDSHLALARRLALIEAAGVPVWVLPGNHDINVPTARGFEGDGWRFVESVDPEAFSAIYADFTLPAGEEAGLSYLAPVDERLFVAMTDVAFYQPEAQVFGLFMAGHAQWLEKALRGMGDAEVITATHHSLIPHTDYARDSYLMFGSDAMAALLRQYGVRLNLSGHLHIQHIACAGALTDAALGAFCVWPHRYALVTLEEDGALEYEARSLDEDILPPGFLAMSRDFFLDVARDKAAAALGDVSNEDACAMADYAARFSLAYFSGTLDGNDPVWTRDAAYALWRSQGDNHFWQYMKQVLEEPGGNHLRRAM